MGRNLAWTLFGAVSLSLSGCGDPVAVEEVLVVINISPANGSANVSVSSDITATFSHGLDESSVAADSVYLVDAAGDVITGSLSYDSDSHTVVLDPTADLEGSADYSVVLTDGLSSVAAGGLLATVRSDFRTEGDVATNTQPVAEAVVVSSV